MNVLSEKHTKYICLFAIILMQCFKVDAILCYQCGGDHPKCSENVKDDLKHCDNKEHTSCFTKIDINGIIERGCNGTVSAQTCTEEEYCISTEQGKNKQLICKKCDKSDENCSTTDMTSNELKYFQICPEGTKKCFLKLDNKFVVRGCANDSDVKQCTDENSCKTCDSVNCNTGIFPTKHIKCYQCSGSNCTDVETNNMVSKPCLNFEEKDECYTKISNETDMVRGCKSDTKDNQCSSADGEGCSFCSADSCNNLKYKKDQILKCHQCSSKDPNNDCFKEQTGQDFQNCKNQILYNETEYCYTQVDGEKIERGCLHDNAELTVDKCKDGDSDTCNKCNSSNGCNSKAVTIGFTCIVCRSDIDKNCWNSADTFEGKMCTTNHSSAQEGCFHGIWNGVAIRGCMVDATIQNQEICKDVKNLQCNVCYKKNCNVNKSSGANKIGIQLAVVIIAIATIWNFK